MKKATSFFLILMTTALLGGMSLKAQTPGEHFDVTHYEIRLWDFDFSAHTLQGEAFVDVIVTAPTNTFVLELKSLTVTDVATESYGVSSFSQNGDLLTIVIDEIASVDETLTLDVRYGGNTFSESWGGVEWWGSGYVYNLGVGFDSQPHNLGKTWFPCVDNFTDKATYSLYITVSNDKKAVCGGTLVNTFDNGDGTTTWHWETPQDIATYHISFAIGDYELWETVYHGIEGDIPVNVYAKPAQMNHVPGTFANVNAIAAFFEQCLGAYPFNRIGYVSTGKGCMEHTDNIAMASSIIDGTTSQEEYVAHELSHMYFGNRVTCSTAGDMWLNEGFAQFWGTFYRSAVYGENDFQQAMRTKTNSVTGWCNSQDHWIPLNNMPLDMTYDTYAVYERGAVIVNTMMNYMGRANFLAGLHHYLDEYTYRSASSEQLRDALFEETGIDMTGFFDTYVFASGMPHFEVCVLETTPQGAQYDVRILARYAHKGSSHVGQNNRVEVTFVDTQGQRHTEMVGWDGLEAEQTLTLDYEPVAAFVDFDNRILDAKYTNNKTFTAPGSLTQSNCTASIDQVTDSVMAHIEAHLVAPYDDPEIIGLNLSTSHYWTFFRHDFGDADVSGVFTFSNNQSLDGDIIHTQNDSAVLLYRADVNDTWHTIPYTQEGNWKLGRFHVSDLASGYYTIAAIDKSIYGLGETSLPTLRVYPNPAHNRLHVKTPSPATDHTYRITNLAGQVLLTGKLRDEAIDISTLPKGAYLIEIDHEQQKFLVY